MHRTSFLFLLSCLPLLAQTVAPSSVATKAPPVVAASSGIALSPQEWAELEKAKDTALKAHPEFQQKNIEISQRIRAFQDKLSAVMLQDDPSLAPFLNHGAASPAILPPKPH